MRSAAAGRSLPRDLCARPAVADRRERKHHLCGLHTMDLECAQGTSDLR